MIHFPTRRNIHFLEVLIMKRILAVMLVLVLALSLAACGSDPSRAIIGTWSSGNYTCTFKGDGTGTVSLDKGTSSSCTWTYNEETGAFDVNYGAGKDVATIATEDGKPVMTWMNSKYNKIG